ncbi:hypothetical protein Goarm_021792 [Gossypium armourianum]|uniref:Josephin-like protein n=1 Tax=Gossypium armourianum TaxID=34283 RepID=A0A7J9ITS9_9ROSI|nr:hypothetical protein [Gossypium armourianum]
MSTKESSKGSQKDKANGSAMDKYNHTKFCGFMRCGRPEFTAVRFLKHLGRKVAKGLHLMSMRIRASSHPKVAASSSTSSSRRSKPFVTPVDSHRSAAIEDCIQFINSSAASLPRSNSVSATSR